MKLTAEEIDLLVDVINDAIDGHVESKELATTDPNLESAEDLVSLSNDIDNTIDLLRGIKRKLHGR